jgi:hypothetical protein
MQFESTELRHILRLQDAAVEVRDSQGFRRGSVTPQTALALVSGAVEWFGVGNPVRVRVIRPASGRVGIASEASVTTIGRQEKKAHHKRCFSWLSHDNC